MQPVVLQTKRALAAGALLSPGPPASSVPPHLASAQVNGARTWKTWSKRHFFRSLASGGIGLGGGGNCSNCIKMDKFRIQGWRSSSQSEGSSRDHSDRRTEALGDVRLFHCLVGVKADTEGIFIFFACFEAWRYLRDHLAALVCSSCRGGREKSRQTLRSARPAARRAAGKAGCVCQRYLSSFWPPGPVEVHKLCTLIFTLSQNAN